MASNKEKPLNNKEEEMQLASEVDPRLRPEFLESPLAAKARGIRKKLCKIQQERFKLLKQLTDNRKEYEQLKQTSIEVQKQLFEEQSLIQVVPPSPSRPKTISKPESSEDALMKALKGLSTQEIQEMVDRIEAKNKAKTIVKK